MRSRIWVCVAVAGVLMGCTAGSDASSALEQLPPRLQDWPSTTVEVATDDATHDLEVVVAATPERRQRGLQDVEEVPDGVGMLFLFERDNTSGFWMKDTLVPLEIAFATHQGEIVTVRSMEPCDDDPCPIYEPDAPYRAALEVPDGWLEERGVAPGDRLTWGEVPEAR